MNGAAIESNISLLFSFFSAPSNKRTLGSRSIGAIYTPKPVFAPFTPINCLPSPHPTSAHLFPGEDGRTRAIAPRLSSRTYECVSHKINERPWVSPTVRPAYYGLLWTLTKKLRRSSRTHLFALRHHFDPPLPFSLLSPTSSLRSSSESANHSISRQHSLSLSGPSHSFLYTSAGQGRPYTLSSCVERRLGATRF